MLTNFNTKSIYYLFLDFFGGEENVTGGGFVEFIGDVFSDTLTSFPSSNTKVFELSNLLVKLLNF